MPIIPTPWLNPIRVNTTDAGPGGDDQIRSQVVGLSDDRFMVVWQDNSVAREVYIRGQMYDALGNPILGEIVISRPVSSTEPTVNEQLPDIAALPDGGFVVVAQEDRLNGSSFESYSNIVTRRYDASGNLVHERIMHSEFLNDNIRPAVAALANGAYAVVWQNVGAADDIYMSVVSAAGVATDPIRLAEGGSGNYEFQQPHIATLNNGNIAVTWQTTHPGLFTFSPQQLMYHEYTLTGQLVFEANYDGDEAEKEIAALGSGNVAFVWQKDNNIQFRVLTPQGVELNGGSAHTNLAGTQIAPVVTALADGGFMVVWKDDTVSEVRAQRFNGNGTMVGSMISLNLGSESDPDIAVLSDGRFAISFTSRTGSNDDVYVSIWDPRTSTNGTPGDDVITGILTGGTLIGLAGNDTLYGSAAVDKFYGDDGNDRMYGFAGDDELYGLADDDYLDGGAGFDLLVGGTGNDTFYLADVNGTDIFRSFDTVIGGTGVDTVQVQAVTFSLGGRPITSANYILPVDVENGVVLGTRAFSLSGNDLNNLLVGNSATNTLSAGRGNDTLYSNAGGFGGGTNTVGGGGGWDHAFYGFNYATTQSTLTHDANGVWTLVNGHFGLTDTLSGVEVATFSNGLSTTTIALREHARSDVSGDGAGDIVWFNPTTRAVSYYETNPAGGYTWHNIGGVGAGYTPLTGDFDGDGVSDILWSNGTNVSTYLMASSGSYTWRNYGSVGAGYTPLAGDFNGDGISDILWSNGTSVSTYLTTKTPNAQGDYYTWRNVGGVTTGYTPYVGDFNGDGTGDILFSNGTNVSTYLIDPTTAAYTWRNVGTVSAGYTPLVGDFSGDGTSDIAWWNQSTGAVSYYEMNAATGGYTWHNIGGVSAGYTPFVRDFNDDGKADIGWTNGSSVSYYNIIPAGGFTWNNIGGVGAGYNVVAS